MTIPVLLFIGYVNLVSAQHGLPAFFKEFQGVRCSLLRESEKIWIQVKVQIMHDHSFIIINPTDMRMFFFMPQYCQPLLKLQFIC